MAAILAAILENKFFEIIATIEIYFHGRLNTLFPIAGYSWAYICKKHIFIMNEKNTTLRTMWGKYLPQDTLDPNIFSPQHDIVMVLVSEYAIGPNL